MTNSKFQYNVFHHESEKVMSLDSSNVFQVPSQLSVRDVVDQSPLGFPVSALSGLSVPREKEG